MNLSSVQGGDFPDEAELHLRGHSHGQTLWVQKVGGHSLRLQPDLVTPAWKAQHSGFNGRAVSVTERTKSPQSISHMFTEICIILLQIGSSHTLK